MLYCMKHCSMVIPNNSSDNYDIEKYKFQNYFEIFEDAVLGYKERALSHPFFLRIHLFLFLLGHPVKCKLLTSISSKASVESSLIIFASSNASNRSMCSDSFSRRLSLIRPLTKSLAFLSSSDSSRLHSSSLNLPQGFTT